MATAVVELEFFTKNHCHLESGKTSLIFGHKSIFITVFYRNPQSKANSDEFSSFLENLDLHENIKNQKPYAMFLACDFNAHSEMWYPEGDTSFYLSSLVVKFRLVVHKIFIVFVIFTSFSLSSQKFKGP